MFSTLRTGEETIDLKIDLMIEKAFAKRRQDEVGSFFE
jgi:hypothetical protein